MFRLTSWLLLPLGFYPYTYNKERVTLSRPALLFTALHYPLFLYSSYHTHPVPFLTPLEFRHVIQQIITLCFLLIGLSSLSRVRSTGELLTEVAQVYDESRSYRRGKVFLVCSLVPVVYTTSAVFLRSERDWTVWFKAYYSLYTGSAVSSLASQVVLALYVLSVEVGRVESEAGALGGLTVCSATLREWRAAYSRALLLVDKVNTLYSRETSLYLLLQFLLLLKHALKITAPSPFSTKLLHFSYFSIAVLQCLPFCSIGNVLESKGAKPLSLVRGTRVRMFRTYFHFLLICGSFCFRYDIVSNRFSYSVLGFTLVGCRLVVFLSFLTATQRLPREGWSYHDYFLLFLCLTAAFQVGHSLVRLQGTKKLLDRLASLQVRRASYRGMAFYTAFRILILLAVFLSHFLFFRRTMPLKDFLFWPYCMDYVLNSVNTVEDLYTSSCYTVENYVRNLNADVVSCSRSGATAARVNRWKAELKVARDTVDSTVRLLSLPIIAALVFEILYFLHWMYGYIVFEENADLGFIPVVHIVAICVRILWITYRADQMTLEASKTAKYLFRLDLGALDESSADEVNLFLDQLDKRKLEAKAYNVINFNMRLAFKTTGLIATYIVLFMQLKQENV